MGTLWYSERQHCIFIKRLILHIGVGTREGRGGAIFYLRDLLIFIHAAQIAAITVYITFAPPKMELLPTPMLQVTNWKLKTE